MRDQGWENSFLNRHPIGEIRRRGLPWSWGYVIYRTVYTPESDQIWDYIMQKLEAYIFREVDRPLWHYNEHDSPATCPPLDAAVHAEIREHLQNTIMNDRAEYDGLSAQSIRAKFNEFLSTFGLSPMRKNDACLMVDEEVLHSIRNAPEPTRLIPEDGDNFLYMHPYIKVVSWVERFAEMPPGNVMKASINLLFHIYRQDMELLFPACDPETGEPDVYEGQIYGHTPYSKRSRQLEVPEDIEVPILDLEAIHQQYIDQYRQAGQEVPPEIIQQLDEMARDPLLNGTFEMQ